VGLSSRISRPGGERGAAAPAGVLGGSLAFGRRGGFVEASRRLKLQVHNRLFETVDFAKLSALDPERIVAHLTEVIDETLKDEGKLITEADRGALVEEIKNELLGLGPLEPLLHDDSITDILVNGPGCVYVEKGGKLLRTDVRFHDDQHLMVVIDRIVSQVGRRIDEASPMVDARMGDGSRVNAVIPPLALDGPCLSIRRFGGRRYTMADLLGWGSLSAEMADFLRAAVRARLSVLICGGTGSGKTTMLNCLSAYVPDDERIVTVEDSAELALQQPHVVRLESRPPNLEGRGEVTQRDLVRNCLRMRPDRIIVGEVRGAEVFDMLQAMSTGHEGSIATIHANNPRESLSRLEMMMLLSGFSFAQRAMRQQIAAAIDLVVHVSRLSDGSRRVLRLSEVAGMEGETIMMQDLFEFVRARNGSAAEITGVFHPTGVQSVHAARLALAGYASARSAARGPGAGA
jgi:pilus assembly protein CpaF